MKNAIDSTLVHRFSCLQSLNAEQIAAFATHLAEVRLAPERRCSDRVTLGIRSTCCYLAKSLSSWPGQRRTTEHWPRWGRARSLVSWVHC